MARTMSRKLYRASICIAIVALAVGVWLSRHIYIDSNKNIYPVPETNRQAPKLEALSSTALNLEGKSSTNPTVKEQVRTPIASPQSVIFNGENAAKSFQAARETFGENDPRIRSLENYAAILCADYPDPLGTVSDRYVDKTRAWAIDRTLRWCEGYTTKTEMQPNTFPIRQSPVSTFKKSGREAAISEAFQIIAQSFDYGELFEAGQFLFENNAFPYQEVLNSLSNLGLPELLQAWGLASMLRTCDAASGCGPGSIPTAAYCANGGCPEGVTFEEALHQTLAPREFQATVAMYQWIMKKQAHH